MSVSKYNRGPGYRDGRMTAHDLPDGRQEQANEIYAEAASFNNKIHIIGLRKALPGEPPSNLEGFGESNTLAGRFVTPQEFVDLFDNIIPGLRVRYVEPVEVPQNLGAVVVTAGGADTLVRVAHGADGGWVFADSLVQMHDHGVADEIRAGGTILSKGVRP